MATKGQTKGNKTKRVAKKEFSRNIFRTVNLEGEVISYTNNSAVLYISDVRSIDFESLSQIKKSLGSKVSIFPAVGSGYGIEISSSSKSFEDSLKNIYKTIEKISPCVPFVQEELSDILLGLDKESIVRTKNTTLIPSDTIHVKGYDGNDYVFYRKGWINNAPSVYYYVAEKMRESCDLNNKINRKDKEQENRVKVFDPFKYGYPSFLIRGMINEALLLKDRAGALYQEALTEAPAECIESLCCAYEDLERGIVILDEIIDSESYDVKDFETSIYVREAEAEIILAKLDILKDLVKYFPSYDMVEREILRSFDDLEELYCDTNKLLIEKESLESDTRDEIESRNSNSNDSTIEDKVEDDEETSFVSDAISEYSNLHERQVYAEEEFCESENPILEYILGAKTCLHDFRISVHYLKNLPNSTTIEIPSDETVEELNVLDRPAKYKAILECCYSDLSNMKKSYRECSSFSPFVHARVFSRMRKLEDEINHFEILSQELSELIEYCDERDLLCFDNDMPIKIIQDAREYALNFKDQNAT